MQKRVLVGKTLSELKQLAQELKMPAFTGKQIAEWLYEKRVTNFSAMTNISKQNREKLSEECSVGVIPPVHQVVSADGTEKYLFALSDGYNIETVYIPDRERATLCVSSQVGCKMNCLFCMTGKQGFQRNLTPAEIMNQILAVPHSQELTNIVFMGMGEPTDNLDSVLSVIEILTSAWGMAWSPKRITLSTVGIRKGVKRFLDESKCHLAVSLHAPDGRRAKYMPAEKAFPMSDMIDMLREYDFSHQRRLSFEYIMLRGVNDSIEDAQKLAEVLKGLDCRVNLIRYHAIPGISFQSSSDETIEAFRNELNNRGVIATIRSSRGEDVSAACGMLASQKANK
ncbi:MAG: 23S rRNA (adenine(2503)-C(2))-methyltransferase RlmN [Muribaculaceae bacterium]|nr:23S rRNA (adenine(2503)-C(2))-methyltransferase RlmN [Muribaculaceae bacterium]